MAKITDADVAQKYIQLKQSAESRGIPFGLSLNTVRRLLTVKTCYYTKKPFSDKQEDADSRTMDRLDNDKGYVEGNVVASCKCINSKKGQLTLEDIKLIYNGVKKLL